MPRKTSSIWGEWSGESRIAYIMRRKAEGYSWRDMASELGVSETTIYSWARRNYPFLTGDFKIHVLREAAHMGLVEINPVFKKSKEAMEHAFEKIEEEEFDGVPRGIDDGNGKKKGKNGGNIFHGEPLPEDVVDDLERDFVIVRDMRRVLHIFRQWFNELDKYLDDYTLARVINRFYEIALNKESSEITDRERMIIIKMIERVLRY